MTLTEDDMSIVPPGLEHDCGSLAFELDAERDSMTAILLIEWEIKMKTRATAMVAAAVCLTAVLAGCADEPARAGQKAGADNDDAARLNRLFFDRTDIVE